MPVAHVKLSMAFLEDSKAYLYQLSGWECPWPIKTAHDLREYAINVADHNEDALTGAELRSVNDLIARLDDALATPAQRKAKAKREARRPQKPEGMDEVTWLISSWESSPEPRTAAWQAAGANARSKQGKRATIITAYRRVKTKDPRARAKIIADEFNVTAIYVRRVVKSAGEK